MDGILIIDKPINYTSRDVVNIVGKNYHTKKVGHTGTLDPLATGVLVVCVNKATKLVELLTCLDKEYIAEFELGTLTNTLDSEGIILKDEATNFTKDEVNKALKEMECTYLQTVPLYSAIKVNGKKLYEYARNGIEVELPKHEVQIFSLELLDLYNQNSKTIIKVKCHVSKGTYIRSLGNDIASKLNTVATMISLHRTRQGSYDIKDAISLESLNENTPLISLIDALSTYHKEVVDSTIEKYIFNGNKIQNIYDEDMVLFIDKNNNALALYERDEDFLKPYKMFVK